MTKKIFTLAVLITCLQAVAQKHLHHNEIRPESISTQHYYFNGNEFSEANLEPYLLQHFAPNSNFVLAPSGEKISKTGKHLHFQLIYQNHPVFNAEVVVHLNNNHSIEVEWPVLPNTLASPSATEPDLKMLLQEFTANDYSDNQEALFIFDGQLLPVRQLTLHGPGSSVRQLVLYGDSVLINTDLRKFNQDTTVGGYVFQPDPLTTANQNYGGLLTDNNDASGLVINNEMVWVNFKATYRQGLFHLESPALKIVEFDAPNVPPVTSNVPYFIYTRNQSGFEDVNCFYHINNFKNTIDSVNHNLPGFQVEADVHALSGSDQSFYSPNIKKLAFGEGGVDDAEDADVIVHEYGHAVVDGAVVGITSVPVERAMLEEAICDYFAVAYSRLYSSNQADRVFNWDGHNEFWGGRMASSSKDYQLENFKNSIYAHTDLMASCLSEIENNIGYYATMDILLESLFRLHTNSTYVDFANSMVQVDQLLNGGANYNVIVTAFQRRNVLAPDFSIAEKGLNQNAIQLSGSSNFAQGGMALLTSTETIEFYTLLSGAGAIIKSVRVDGQREVDISGESLAKGIYILQVQTSSKLTESFKLIRW